jgi:hypothetical protein
MTLEVPAKYRAIYARAMTGKSRKAACRAFCLQCVAWSEAEVRRCTAPDCPLYPYRPKADQAADSTADDSDPET